MKKLSRTLLFAIIFAFVFGTVSVAETRAQGVLNEILKRMDTHKDWLETLKGNVRMAKTNTQLNITTTQDGEMVYVNKGGRDVAVRIDWREPDEVLSVIKGEYTLYRKRLNQAIKGKTQGSKNAQANNALSFMSMSKKELTDTYDVKYLGKVSLDGTQVWHLGLYPKKKQSYESAELWVDGDGMPIQAKIIEKNKDVTTVRLSNLKKNEVRINTKVFEVKLPSNVQIIKG